MQRFVEYPTNERFKVLCVSILFAQIDIDARFCHPMREFIYGDCRVRLTPAQQPDGQWLCQVRITDCENIHRNQQRGYAGGLFSSSLQAEIAALTQAKRLIDAREPRHPSGSQLTQVADRRVEPGVVLHDLPYPDTHYNGTLVKLSAEQHADGRWRCRYLVMDNWRIPVPNREGYSDGYVVNLSEARTTALDAAKLVIDSFESAY